MLLPGGSTHAGLLSPARPPTCPAPAATPPPTRFVLAMESGFLYYFKSPEQMSTPGISPKVVAIGPEAPPAGRA